MLTDPQSSINEVQDIENDDELYNERIKQILENAHHRLHGTTPPSSSLKSLEPFTSKDGEFAKPYVRNVGQIARLDTSKTRQKVEGEILQSKKQEQGQKTDSGSQWFNLPSTNTDPSIKKHLQLLKLRGVLDPGRFYKQESKKGSEPKYAQLGTVVEGPGEFYGGRLVNRERKRTFVEEVLEREKETGYFRRRYGEIQERKRSGKKGYYRDLKAKRAKRF
ncbi:MAG: hypothetical protein Q9190_002713 [Brigantiaea leucoxantha]